MSIFAVLWQVPCCVLDLAVDIIVSVAIRSSLQHNGTGVITQAS